MFEPSSVEFHGRGLIVDLLKQLVQVSIRFSQPKNTDNVCLEKEGDKGKQARTRVTREGIREREGEREK